MSYCRLRKEIRDEEGRFVFEGGNLISLSHQVISSGNLNSKNWEQLFSQRRMIYQMALYFHKRH